MTYMKGLTKCLYPRVGADRRGNFDRPQRHTANGLLRVPSVGARRCGVW